MKKMVLVRVCFLLCLVASLAALAEVKRFQTNNGWLHVDGNWDPSGVPGAGDIGIIGGDASTMRAICSGNLPATPQALIVRTNGMVSLNLGSMSGEHNIILDGGTLNAVENRQYYSSVALRSDSFFLCSGSELYIYGLVKDADDGAGHLIITNSSATLGGQVVMAGANNTYSGGTTVHAGTLQIANTDTLGSGSVELLPGSDLFYTANISLRSPLMWRGGRLRVGANYGLTSTNRVSGDLVFNSTAVSASFGGVIEDFSVSEPGRLVKIGSGNIFLNTVDSTYTGGTLISQGVITVNSKQRVFGPGDVIVTNGAQVRIYSTATPVWDGYDIIILDGATVRLQSTGVGNSCSNVVVREGGIIMGHDAGGNYGSYDRIRIEGAVNFMRRPNGNYLYWHGAIRDGAVPGRLVFTGTGTYPTYIAAANTYSGGTEISDGGPTAAELTLYNNGRMPDTGEILIHTNGVLNFNGISDVVGGLAGVGTVKLGKATVTVNEGVSPGTNAVAAGALTVQTDNALGRLTLAAASTNLFHLKAPADSDRVVFDGPANLTLGGVIRVEKLGKRLPSAGDYTLFALDGGTIDGVLPELIMPEYCKGTLSTASGDVVLTLRLAPPGTVVIVR